MKYLISFFLSIFPVTANAAKSVMEGIVASKQTVLIDTTNTRVDIATASYNGKVSNVGLYSSSNVVISNTNGDNCIIYATGSITCLGIGSVFGNGTANYIPKWSGSTTLANTASPIFESGGNIGIGTTLTTALDQVGIARPLVLAGSDDTTTVAGGSVAIVISNLSQTSGATANLDFSKQPGGSGNHMIGAEISAIFSNSGAGQYAPTALAFSVGRPPLNIAPVEAMRISSNGFVGIGTTNPTQLLTVHESTNQNVKTLEIGGNTGLAGLNDNDSGYVPFALQGQPLLLNPNNGAGIIAGGATAVSTATLTVNGGIASNGTVQTHTLKFDDGTSQTTAGGASTSGNNTWTGTNTFNGQVSFGVTNSSVSAAIALPSNTGDIIINHGFSSTPYNFGADLVNTTTNCGYAVNDRIRMGSYAVTGQAGNNVWASSTQIGFQYGANIVVSQKGVNADCVITSGDWSVIIWGQSF